MSKGHCILGLNYNEETLYPLLEIMWYDFFVETFPKYVPVISCEVNIYSERQTSRTVPKRKKKCFEDFNCDQKLCTVDRL